jgi:two-component system chemotaxis response regulator CheB
MQVARDGNSRIIRLNQNPPENSCRPAVDVLFRSVAEIYGSSTIGVIMTGMGHDGLEGTRLLKGKGAVIIAQDKDTSVVWGMPKFVTEEGLADRICALQDIEPAILEMSGFARRSPRPAQRKTWSASAR